MPNKPRPRFIRRDLSNPKDMETMLRSGAIWKFTDAWQDGIDAIKSGVVPIAECKDIPPEVMRHLTRGR